MEKKDIIKNTSHLVTTRLFQFITGLVKMKLNALILGPTGVGVFNQVSTLTSRLNLFTTLSMNSALIKQIAESRARQDFINILSTSLKLYTTLILGILVICILALLAYADYITVFIFGDPMYRFFFFLSVVAVPLLVLDSIPNAILQGFKGMKYISVARIVTTVVNLLIFLPLLLQFELDGAIIFFPLSYFFSLLINYYYAYRYFIKPNSITLREILHAPYDGILFKEFITFGVFGLTSGTFSIVVDLVTRSLVVNHLGIDKLGVYSPNINWGILFTGFILPALQTYLYPRFCEINNQYDNIKHVVNDAIRIATFMISPLLFIVLPLRYVLIPLFYSPAFLIAGQYMPFHFIGITFHVWYYILMLVFTPTGNIKLHGVLSIFYSSLDVAVVYLLVPKCGMWGWMLKFLISPVIFFVIYYLVLAFKISFRFTTANCWLMFYVFVCASGQIALTFLVRSQALATVLGMSSFGVLWFFLQENERIAVVSTLRSRIFKKRTIV